MGGKDSFHRKRLRWRLQTFAGAVANVCGNGCKRLRENRQCHCILQASTCNRPRKYVQPFPQVRASETNSRTYIQDRRSRTNMSYGTFLIHYLTG